MIKPVGSNVSRTTKFLRSKTLGKVLDVAADNQALCNSLFALAICLGPRPLTNFALTKDKQDATYASCHSISSGVIGYLWPLIFLSPISKGMKNIAKNPAKYLKAETIQKFYPNVMVEKVEEDGKQVLKVVKNEAGKMLDKQGRELFQGNEPLMVYDKEVQAKFMKNYPNCTIFDGENVVRSKSVFKTENGVLKEDKSGVKKGVSVQAKNYEVCEDGFLRVFEKDKNGDFVLNEAGERIGHVVPPEDITPITEEMEIGEEMETNAKKIINMVPDILLAPIRASLTIALIPPVLNMFGIKKSDKSKAGQPAQQSSLNVVSQANNTVVKAAPQPQVFAQVQKGATK